MEGFLVPSSSAMSEFECEGDAANKWVLRKSNVAYTLTDAKRQRNVLLLLLLL